jgi:hypothetical protein
MTSPGGWLKRLFGSQSEDDEVAEREEYTLPDTSQESLEQGGHIPGPLEDSARAVGHELDEFKAPRDPNP